jgi:hypothetical protein
MPAADSHPLAPDASPLAYLLRAYDLAIGAARAHDARAAYRHIATLRAAHPCDTPSAAGIDGLYAWCERLVLGGDFLGAVRTLEQLRSAWQQADRLTAPAPTLRRLADDRQRDDERDAGVAVDA